MNSGSDHPIGLLRELRAAVQNGEREQIILTIPEPPEFLSALFALQAQDRDEILTVVFSVLETDEDRWELVEAATMHSVAYPEQGSLLSLLPYIPQSLREDLQILLNTLPVSESLTEVRRALKSNIPE